MNIKDCVRKALGSIGAFINWDCKKETADPEVSPEAAAAAEKLNAKIKLTAAGCMGRKRPPVLGLIILTALLVGALYVELHLMAFFIALALVLSLVSYVTIQKWIDIVGDDHQKPPVDHGPRPEPDGSAYQGA